MTKWTCGDPLTMPMLQPIPYKPAFTSEQQHVARDEKVSSHPAGVFIMKKLMSVNSPRITIAKFSTHVYTQTF